MRITEVVERRRRLRQELERTPVSSHGFVDAGLGLQGFSQIVVKSRIRGFCADRLAEPFLRFHECVATEKDQSQQMQCSRVIRVDRQHAPAKICRFGEAPVLEMMLGEIECLLGSERGHRLAAV